MIFLTVATLVGAAPVAAGASISASVDGSGHVALSIFATVSNGSALRYAMDGNFAPLIEGLPINASQQATILSDIATVESSFLTSSLFGNKDGTVQPGEVAQFSTLLTDESQFLPAGTLTSGGGVFLTLDGGTAQSATLQGVSFTNATGPDASTAPIGVSTALSYAFASKSGTHTIALGTNLSTTNVNLGLLVGPVAVTLTTPSATTISGTSGFTSVSVTNDPLGWGGASLAGAFTPGTDTSVHATYAPSFPTGDVLIVVPPVLVVGAAGALVWRRRRRRRAAA